MANIDNVTDLTFSQPIVTADEVAEEIVKLCANDKPEQPMPWISGWFTTLSYLFPGFGRLMRPLLLARGRRVKRELKAKMRAGERD
jgi:hypothetical protein